MHDHTAKYPDMCGITASHSLILHWLHPQHHDLLHLDLYDMPFMGCAVMQTSQRIAEGGDVINVP